MIKVRNVETAVHAEENKELINGVNILGLFDNLVQPLFPIPLSTLSIIVAFEGLTAPTVMEARINSPQDELIAKTSFGVMPDTFGYGRKILSIEKFLVEKPGRYTMDIFEISTEGKPKFLSTEHLFIADIPPKREISDSEKARILADENLIKTIKTEYKPLEFVADESLEPIKIQFSLNENEAIEEGHIVLGEDCTVEYNGKTFDLTGLKRHIEWMYGQPIPKANNEATDETKNEEVEKEEEHKCCGQHEHHDEDHVCGCGCGHKH